MDDVYTFLTAIVGAGGLGAVLGVLTKFLVDRRVLNRSVRKDEFENMQSILDRQERRIKHLEEQHSECLENNARLQVEVGSLREAVRRLEDMLESRAA